MPDARRIKLDDKSLTCVLLGVSSESKGTKMYDLLTKQILVSRDVKFEKDKQWKWESKDNPRGENLKWENEESGETEDVTDADQFAREGTAADVRDETGTASNDQGNFEPISRESRVRKPPSWLQDYAQEDDITEEGETHLAFIVSVDPVTFEKVVKHARWREAMDNEIKSIEKKRGSL